MFVVKELVPTLEGNCRKLWSLVPDLKANPASV